MKFIPFLRSLLGRVVQGARLKIEYVRMREFEPHSRQIVFYMIIA